MTKLKPPRRIWVLFDADGEAFNHYATRREADEDAVGPRFYGGHTVRAYDLVPRKEEKGAKK